MHDNLQFAATLLAIATGVLFSRNDARRLEGRLEKLEAKTDALRTEIHKDIADLRGELTRKTDTIVAMLFDHTERLVKVEAGKQDKQ